MPKERLYQCPSLVREDFLPDIILITCIHQARIIDLILGVAVPEIVNTIFLAPGEEAVNTDGQWYATYTGICSRCHTTYFQMVSAPFPNLESWDLFNTVQEQDSEDPE